METDLGSESEATEHLCESKRLGVNLTIHRSARKSGLFWGVAAGLGLVLVYVGTLALANSLEHALGEFIRLWYWMVPLILGFSLQIGLFAYGRMAARQSSSVNAGGVAASGGTSTVAMVACCAHHLTDVLPLVGLAGAAYFLGTYQHLFLLLGLLSNVVGLVYVLSILSRNGLYPARKSALSLVMKLPLVTVLRLVLAGAVVIFAIEVLLEFV